MNAGFRLVTACCRWPDDAARAARIRGAAAAVNDWDQVLTLAQRHRVEPLVAHGLAAAGIDLPPALVVLAQHARSHALRDIGEYLRIAAALDKAGIVYRFLKGAPLGVAVYGTPTLKRSWDIDLLVLPSDAIAVAATLHELGYASVMPPRALDKVEFARWAKVSKEAEFRSAGGTTVELHWRVSDHPMLLRTVTASSPARLVGLLGAHQVMTLADDVNLAYLAVHGASHAWFRLKWIADFHALLVSIDPGLRPASVARAASYPVGRALESAIDLSRRLFGDDHPPIAASSNRVTQASLAALAEPDEAIATGLAAPLRWDMAPGASFRWSEAALRWRGTLDRLEYPLPPRLQFLYPVLRLPFWLLRKWKRHSGGTKRL